MKVITSLTEHSGEQKPVVLTIGNFDGMHYGHKSVLNRTKERAVAEGRKSVVITFDNHPAEILRPQQKKLCLCTLQHKICLLKTMGIDILILLSFTKELSQQTAETFLQCVYASHPFAWLVLGHDATLGKEREGDRATIQAFAKRHHFQVDYLEPYSHSHQGLPVSSSHIRTLIQVGNLKEAENLLGRKYSIYSTVIAGLGKGKVLGFPTANIDVTGLCCPPFGVYAITLLYNQKLFDAVGNLGLAPTVRNDQKPLLEVHLLEREENLYGQEVEVFFIAYIRPEKKFSSLEELQAQIAQDVQVAGDLLNKNSIVR